MNKCNPELVLGQHILIDLFDCQCDPLLLGNLVEGNKLMDKLAKLINPLGRSTYQFEPCSYSIVLLLMESHLSVHTWVQHKFASWDFYTCSGTFLEEAVNIVIEAFQPLKIERVDIERGKTKPKIKVY